MLFVFRHNLAPAIASACRCFAPNRSAHKMAEQDDQYEEAVRALNQLQVNEMMPASKKYEGFGLVAMKSFLSRVNITEGDLEKLNIIHVAGTKGKGSTCAFVESVLRHHGVKTGFFSSPHLVEVRERLRICGKPISRELFTDYFWKVYNLLEVDKEQYGIKFPSYFYFLTVLGFYVFKHEKVHGTVVEVGIGGTYDCTNVISKPTVCGVSSLGIDHCDLLGKTINSIAWHKGGIFKSDVPAFTVSQPEDGLDVLKQQADCNKTTLKVAPGLESYNLKRELELGLSGEHQKINASLAVQLSNFWLQKHMGGSAFAGSSLNENTIKGLENCVWNGRGQIIKFASITFYLDGAHTMRSIDCAANWFEKASAAEAEQLKRPCTKILMFNVTKKRDTYNFLSHLFRCGFSKAVFAPNIATLLPSHLNDQNNLKYPVESGIAQVLQNQDEWKALCDLNNQSVIAQQSPVFPCISDAITWMSKGRDKTLHDLAKSLCLEVAYPDYSSGTEHLQVLVTGSLYLVGGCLRVIKPNLND